jgi:DNA-binding CsgD family transcriptional regulator
MELIERDGFLTLLQTQFQNITTAEGHCVFVSGEAGIGKTALVKAFCKEQKKGCNIYQGACDALFTPRPLAPLYDIMWQVNSGLWPNSHNTEDRSAIFAGFFRELSNQKEKSIIVFEDIHWADEATLDFIKFFARRISQLRCLFILTYREDEIHSRHPLKNVLGQLPPDSFSRLKLTPLSRHAVEKMASERGYNGEDVYGISGGNPFYVNEILAWYSIGVPDNIKDSILSIYNRQDEKTKYVWEILSILPTGFDIRYFERIEPSCAASIQKSVDATILILEGNIVFFKHELYRRTLETSLSPLTRIAYNKKILDLFLQSNEKEQAIERIVHHAKNANEYAIVVQFAPLAARQAAAVGAHIEASRLYLTAIEYYQGNDPDILIEFYEGYAYECYLTSNNKEGIIYARKSLNLLKEKKDTEKIGNCFRFLSRLWWFAGSRKNAEHFAEQAIEVLSDQSSSSSKAMAFSNMSQLKMLADQSAECIAWGDKAIAIAKELNDEETLCHAMNNVGSMRMKMPVSTHQGLELLEQSLQIALKNSYHDHVARAYCNIAGTSCTMKNYLFAGTILDKGIAYCEERDLDAYAGYMLSWKARLNFETGLWTAAYHIADNLVKNENQSHAVKIAALAVVAKIKIRRGERDAVPLLLEARAMAFETMELQRIIPVMIGLLEYEWITGKTFIEEESINRTISMINAMDGILYNNEFAFWLLKARNQQLSLSGAYEGFDLGNAKKVQCAAALWKKAGSPYMEALALFEGNEDDKRKAVTIVHELGATAVYEKMKLEMRISGIKSIPRGVRKTTQSNPAFLTGRELDVLQLLKENLQNKEIAAQLFISAKTVDHHISSILFKLDVKSRTKAVTEAVRQEILK